MNTITVPEKLTGTPYLRAYQTIKTGGVDSKIMEIRPYDRKIQEIPADITVIFNDPVEDITIVNLIDDTEIDMSYVTYAPETRVKYDFYEDKQGFPTSVLDDIYVLTWKYYFTTEPWVIFKLNYTDTDGNELQYEFTIYNEAFVKPGDYILPEDRQP